MLNYSIANFFANGWLNIEDYAHPLYWVKGNISSSVHVLNNKVQNRLIMYFVGQKRNLSNMIGKLKEPWTALNLKAIRPIFHPDQLHSCCHFPTEVEKYFSKRLDNVKDKYQNSREDELYTNNYEPGEVALGWGK